MVAFSLMILMSTKKIFERTMTIGGLSSGIQYLNQFVDTVGFFLHFGEGWQNILVSLKRIDEVMALENEISGTEQLNSVKTIKIQNLSYRLDNGKYLFRGFNYTFFPGKIYCIQGSNGAGKSTFLTILAGMEKNYEGAIFYDRFSATDLNMVHLRKSVISFVEQHPCMYFTDTSSILTFNRVKQETLAEESEKTEDAEEAQEVIGAVIRHVTALSGDSTGFLGVINEHVKKAEDLDTILSGGEKQKLAVIRALVKDTDVLILDEPTSNLDAATVEALILLLRDICKTKIVIVVSHDSKVAESADEIINISMANVAAASVQVTNAFRELSYQ
ncbi:MAG: ABC transporter ATP-binding protein [Oligoflexia bacterium]|nr:ABC transporter ATP-binding protein [Oligoflexia bacterium]